MKIIKKYKFYFIIGGILFMGLIITIIVYFSLNANINSKLTKVSDVQMLWPQISKNNEVFYFKNIASPGFYKMDLKTKKEEKISDNLDTPDKVIFSPNFDYALIFLTYDKDLIEKYGGPFIDYTVPNNTPTIWGYRFQDKTLKRLDTQIKQAIWYSPDKILIQYYTQEDKAVFATANFNGEDPQYLYGVGQIGIEKIIAFQNNKIYYLVLQEEGVRALDILDLNNNKVNQLDIQNLGSNVYVSPEISANILFTKENPQKGVFWTPETILNVREVPIKNDFKDALWLNNDSVVLLYLEKSQEKFATYNVTNAQITNLRFKNKLDLKAINLFTIDKINLYFTADDYLYQLELK